MNELHSDATLVCPECGSDQTGTLEKATIWQRATFTAVPEGDGEVTTVGGLEAVVEWDAYDSEDVGDTETVGWCCKACLTTWTLGEYRVVGDPSTAITACPFVPRSESVRSGMSDYERAITGIDPKATARLVRGLQGPAE